MPRERHFHAPRPTEAGIDPASHRRQVVIIGGGFGGLSAARRLAHADVDVTIVDQRNHHLFQPLLYQVATSGLHPQDVARPLRASLRRRSNLQVRLGTVAAVDWDDHAVRLADGGELLFDYLVVAAGAVTTDYGVPGVAEHALVLKSLDQAIRLRDHLLSRFELAAMDPTAVDRGALRFVLVGGGPTGVELAGALVELVDVLARDFPDVDTSEAEIVLVEQQPKLLPGFHEHLQDAAEHSLRNRDVDLRLASGIAEVEPGAAVLTTGERLPTTTTIWAAGVRAHPLADSLGVAQTRGGRIVVDDDLRIPEHPEAFAIGDIAAANDRHGRPLPQIAPAAIQQGKYVARQIARLEEGKPTTPFRYLDKGTMATIGRNAAVADIHGLHLRGFVAWAAWLLVHLTYLVGFRNRASVLLSWVWSYLTHDREVRAIVEPDRQPAKEPEPTAATGKRPTVEAAASR